MAVKIVVDRYMNVVLASASKPIFGGFPNPCNDQAVDVMTRGLIAPTKRKSTVSMRPGRCENNELAKDDKRRLN